MAGPYAGRVARLYKDAVLIAYGKNISVKMTAEAVKDSSMDHAAPELLASGNQGFTFSIDRLYVDEAYGIIITGGTTFTIIFAPSGVNAAPKVTLTGCVITSCEHSAGESGAVLEKVAGEALTCVAISS
jgi:hypothetical protein